MLIPRIQLRIYILETDLGEGPASPLVLTCSWLFYRQHRPHHKPHQSSLKIQYTNHHIKLNATKLSFCILEPKAKSCCTLVLWYRHFLDILYGLFAQSVQSMNSIEYKTSFTIYKNNVLRDIEKLLISTKRN